MNTESGNAAPINHDRISFLLHMPVEALDKRRAMTQMSDGENLLEGVMLSQSADVLRVTSRTPFRMLGSASIGDDLALTRNIVAMSAAKAQQSPDPVQQLHNWAIQAGINEPYVGVLTAGSVQGYLAGFGGNTEVEDDSIALCGCFDAVFCRKVYAP